MTKPGPPQQSTLVLEAKAETALLRSSLASERIKSAKQTAKFRSLQEQASARRDREADHTATISRLKTEMDAIRLERDRLRNENSDLRAKTASLPELLKMVTQIRTLETSLSGMTSSVQSLSSEISHMKQEIKKKDLAPIKTVKKPPPRSRRSARKIDPSKTEMITVVRGDSLWRLARQYGTSVKQLKALNSLKRDLIVVGKLLRVPALLPQPKQELAKRDLPKWDLGEQDLAEMPSPARTPHP
ncbi:MAG: LysM peptidoglycan-binding domain-containing protein [Nitrospirota bacterium]|nr:LysM peptidoglycan-binding domain-containing protein [Nitrospirota bacterium]